ncbi:MAG: hypothetical protein KJ621_10605, partial [Proteobacteria bacterium]|nr:hypothetical protein [Pseudomonadota bacterium]
PCPLHRQHGRRVVTTLPDLYRPWARVTGHEPDQGPAGQEPAAPVERRCPRIIDPQTGDRYAVDPGVPASLQYLVVRACAGGRYSAFEWKVNGKLIKKTRRLTDLRWPLTSGRHVITLVLTGDGRQIKRSVTISVR